VLHVSGKCSVTLLNELEDVRTYLVKEDTFFYSMVYDPNVKNLLVDKGDIRVGTDFQAEVPPYVPPGESSTPATPLPKQLSCPSESREEPSHLATKVWEPNKMPDHKVEQFLVVARSIGTFARALLDGAKKPQISLRLGAAAASRDITLVGEPLLTERATLLLFIPHSFMPWTPSTRMTMTSHRPPATLYLVVLSCVLMNWRPGHKVYTMDTRPLTTSPPSLRGGQEV
jgi:hypothetical protein